MTQLTAVLKTLEKKASKKTPGLSADEIALKAKVPRATVSKRISDLRKQGNTIYTNTRMVEGQVKHFYRMAG